MSALGDEKRSLVRVCRVGEVTVGEMKSFEVEGFPPVAIFNLQGVFFATSNICTHQLAFLTDGYFEDDVVECPIHGGSFNIRTGAPASLPCVNPLQTFESIVEDGYVFVRKP